MITANKTKAWKDGWNNTIRALIDCTEKIDEFIQKMKEKIVVAQENSMIVKVAWQYAEGAKEAIDAWEYDAEAPDFVEEM